MGSISEATLNKPKIIVSDLDSKRINREGIPSDLIKEELINFCSRADIKKVTEVYDSRNKETCWLKKENYFWLVVNLFNFFNIDQFKEELNKVLERPAIEEPKIFSIQPEPVIEKRIIAENLFEKGLKAARDGDLYRAEDYTERAFAKDKKNLLMRYQLILIYLRLWDEEFLKEDEEVEFDRLENNIEARDRASELRFYSPISIKLSEEVAEARENRENVICSLR